ncbi:hypothetical protein GCM10010412_091960 [Nonomuraea recticatena]|uniref:Transposase n=1 Tax=Nonomuraea recticatena TaxID=46178 RepID=A0ABN3TAR6_9ACTN
MIYFANGVTLGERGPIPDLRQQFNAVMWRFRTGSPWRDQATNRKKRDSHCVRPVSHDPDLYK